jgi:hypothetical protein
MPPTTAAALGAVLHGNAALGGDCEREKIRVRIGFGFDPCRNVGLNDSEVH